MTGYSWVLVAALLVVAAGDVTSVVRSDRELSLALRPAFGVLLLALAWLLRADQTATGVWVMAAVAVAAVADGLAMATRVRSALATVGGYAASHLGFTVALLLALRSGRFSGHALLGVLAALLCAGAVVVFLTPVTRETVAIGLPLTLGALPLVVLTGLAWGSGSALVVAGATCLLLAALAVGFDRLIRPSARMSPLATTAQRVGQLALVVALLV